MKVIIKKMIVHNHPRPGLQPVVNIHQLVGEIKVAEPGETTQAVQEALGQALDSLKSGLNKPGQQS
ncbi:MAG: hypothetical protein RQ756_01865 [Flavobacteriaceae bacterium]|nr:hypothetical protein [Flavobacteriaceae bacterium]